MHAYGGAKVGMARALKSIAGEGRVPLAVAMIGTKGKNLCGRMRFAAGHRYHCGHQGGTTAIGRQRTTERWICCFHVGKGGTTNQFNRVP